MDGYGDLRVDHFKGEGEESFWPSFTDIMTAVVIIFLLISSVLIARNWELVRELTSTVEAERKAKETAQLTLAENLTLEERLAALEEALSIAQLRQMQTQDEKTALQQRFEALLGELSQSNTLLERLKAQLAARTEEIQAVIQQLSALRGELAGAREELGRHRAELAAAKTTISALEANQVEKEAALREAQTRLDRATQSRSQLEDEYLSLKTKYDRLVRPARSSKGKFIATVRYQRVGGSPLYDIKESETAEFVRVSETELHRRLQALKDQHKDQLYIRIVFPDDNKLTYKDAWQFTNDVLSKYDYYYQGQAVERVE